MWNSHRKIISPLTRQEEAGSISAPFLILSLILASSALASLSHSILWKSKVALQLRLDECVESVSLELEKVQNLIEASNLRIKIERAAAISAAVPTAGASLRAAKPVLIAEQLFQETLRMKWRTRQATWILKRGCDSKGDLFLPLPNLEWWRPPEDPVGPQALVWKGEKKIGLKIRLWRSNRGTAAKVANGERNENHWDANWTNFY